jgi:hypothetical protein
VAHRRVCAKFCQQLCLHGCNARPLRLHLSYDTGNCSTDCVPSIPPPCVCSQVEVEISTFCSAGATSQPERAHRQIFDTVLDAVLERGLTQLTRLALHAHHSTRVFTLPYNTIAAIITSNPCLTGLSLRGMPLDPQGLGFLSEAVELGGVQLTSLDLVVASEWGGGGGRGKGWGEGDSLVEALDVMLSSSSLTSLQLVHAYVSGSAATALARALTSNRGANTGNDNAAAQNQRARSGDSSNGGDGEEGKRMGGGEGTLGEACPPLRSLVLKDCKLGPIEMLALHQLLLQARDLECLDLSCNLLNSVGLEQVASAFSR